MVAVSFPDARHGYKASAHQGEVFVGWDCGPDDVESGVFRVDVLNSIPPVGYQAGVRPPLNSPVSNREVTQRDSHVGPQFPSKPVD